MRTLAACLVCSALLLASACGKKPAGPSSDPALSDASSTDVSTDGSGGSLPDGETSDTEGTVSGDPASGGRRRPKTPAAPVQTGRGPRTPRDRSRPHPLRPTGWRSISSEIAGARSPAPSLDRWRSRNAIPTPCRATATSGRGPGRTTTICIRPTATAPASAVSTAISRWAA